MQRQKNICGKQNSCIKWKCVVLLDHFVSIILIYGCWYLHNESLIDPKNCVSRVLSFYTATVVVEDTGVAAPSGVTLANRWSLFWVQLRPHSWQDAQQELQQGKKRNTLMRHRNQPGAQQHQHIRTPPAVTPRTTYRASREMECWDSEKKKILLYKSCDDVFSVWTGSLTLIYLKVYFYKLKWSILY